MGPLCGVTVGAGDGWCAGPETPSPCCPQQHPVAGNAGGGRPPPATLPNSKGVIRFPPVWWGWVGFSAPPVCLKELDFHSRETEACREHSLRENERRPLTPATISPVSPRPAFAFSSLVLQLSRVIKTKLGSPSSRGPRRPGRRSRSAGGERGRPPGVIRGPPNRAGDEPARGGRRAAASPRLAERSAWGAAAAGSPRAFSEAAEQGAQSPPARQGAAPRRSLAAPGCLASTRRAAARKRCQGPGGKIGRSDVPASPGRRASQGAPRAALEPPPPPPPRRATRAPIPGEGAAAPRESPGRRIRSGAVLPWPELSLPNEALHPQGPSPPSDIPRSS